MQSTSVDDVKTRPKGVVGSPLVTVAGCDGCRDCMHPDGDGGRIYKASPYGKREVERVEAVDADESWS